MAAGHVGLDASNGAVNEYLLGGVNAAAFLLCTSFLAYVACIVVPLVRHRQSPSGDPAAFEWHFLLPCLNEERVVAATVSDLLAKFPTAHVWCIDDASTDGTLRIVSQLATQSRRVHVVIRQPPDAQQGKGPALNAGWAAIADHLPTGADLDRIIVGVLDADGILDPACPAVIAGPSFFGKPEVSAVQIQVRVVNQGPDSDSARARVLIRMQDMEFTCVIAGMQMLRSHVGSTAMGGNGQFTRASALQKVTGTYGTPWATALLEDFELGLRVLLTGGRTEYCHDTSVLQQGPPTVGRLIRQRCRWAQGLMQCFRYFLPVMRSRKISSGAAMEITMFLLLPWFQLLGILVYLMSLVFLAFYAVTTTGGPLHWFGAGAWGLIPLFIVFGLAPLAIWGPIYRGTAARELTRRQALGLGLVNWPYSYIHHVSTWWAFGRMLRSRHDWKKTERLEPAGTELSRATAGVADRAGLPLPVPVPASISASVSPEPQHVREVQTPAGSRERGRGPSDPMVEPRPDLQSVPRTPGHTLDASNVLWPPRVRGVLRVLDPSSRRVAGAGRRSSDGEPARAGPTVVVGRLRLVPSRLPARAASRQGSERPDDDIH